MTRSTLVVVPRAKDQKPAEPVATDYSHFNIWNMFLSLNNIHNCKKIYAKGWRVLFYADVLCSFFLMLVMFYFGLFTILSCAKLFHAGGLAVLFTRTICF